MSILGKFLLEKYNPNHDEKGRFAAGDGGGGAETRSQMQDRHTNELKGMRDKHLSERNAIAMSHSKERAAAPGEYLGDKHLAEVRDLYSKQGNEQAEMMTRHYKESMKHPLP